MHEPICVRIGHNLLTEVLGLGDAGSGIECLGAVRYKAQGDLGNRAVMRLTESLAAVVEHAHEVAAGGVRCVCNVRPEDPWMAATVALRAFLRYTNFPEQDSIVSGVLYAFCVAVSAEPHSVD